MADKKYSDWQSCASLDQLRTWVREGHNDESIAGKIGITPRTLKQWQRQHPDIADALRRGSNAIDVQVEQALLKCAIGFSYSETIEEDTPSGPKTRRSEKYVPPDVHAILFWLKNRLPDLWSDKPIGKSDSGILKSVLEAVQNYE